MALIGFFLPLVLMFGIFYFLLIRPQTKERKRLEELISNLKIGDKILTISGIEGEIVSIKPDEDFFVLKTEGTRLKMKKQAISGKVYDN